MGIKDLDELRAFVQVADSDSLTKAGRVLGRSTTLVSRQLARLEERVGVSLATRTTRRLTLTDEGQRLLVHARRILGEADDALDSLQQRSPFDGVLRFVAPSLIAERLRQGIRNCLEEHPGLSVESTVTDEPPETVARMLAERGLDAAITVGAVPERSLIARRITTIKGVLAASKAYFDERDAPTCPSDLRQHECLCYIAGERPVRDWVLHRNEESETVRVQGRLSSSSSQELLAALVAGQGIGLTMRDTIDELDLVPVLPAYHFLTLPVWILYMENRRASPKLKLLETLLREALADMSRE